jgi:ABC-type oligopeptide transport system substrate-binding subunit
VADLQSFRKDVQSLVTKFEQDKNHYLSKGYPEAQVRIDFLNPLFEALGWDIENKNRKPPHERDVIVELSPETSLRPDYNFRINGNTRFFVEAPIRVIDFKNSPEKSTHDKLVSLVERMLDRNKKKAALLPSAEREKIEREIAVTDEKIDEIVYGLYGVTEEEKKIIETGADVGFKINIKA